MPRKTSAGLVDLKKHRMLPGVMLLNTVSTARNLAVSCDLTQWLMRAPNDPMEPLADVKAIGFTG